MMRRISAHFILTGAGDVLEKGIITVNDEGIITDLVNTGGDLTEISSLEFYNGVIIPGFVNAHCHLELSHLKNIFPEKTQLPGFLENIFKYRGSSEEIVLDAAKNADQEMWDNGISAVGDISNNQLTFPLKSASPVYYHTFIEALGFSPERAERAFDWAFGCLENAKHQGLAASLVPHAPYSISKELFYNISDLAEKENSILSIHNQESTFEDDLFLLGSGPIADHLTENLMIDLSFFKPSGKSALDTILDWLPQNNNLLFVHNLYTKNIDIELISKRRAVSKTWFVLCPNSNLHIEDRLPDIHLFRQKNLQICIGTDSLASNRHLSVLEEIKTIQAHFPQIPLSEIITWATRNGAEALDINHWAGSIEKGKKPGINLISEIDLQKMQLLPHSKIKRLI
jgi:aminodeoxyfutalosine deaminase